MDEENPPHIIRGIELSKKLTKQDAFDLAKNMIRVYVERGDSIQDLKSGQMGRTLGEFIGHGSIGHHINEKWYDTNNLVITFADERYFIFKLKDVFDSIKSKQTSLF